MPTDNGTEFVNQTLRSLAQEYGIVHTMTPPYHPQANPVERVNRVLKAMIVSYIDQDHRTWDQYLPELRFAYNTSYHASLKISPAFLNLGRDPSLINSLRRNAEAGREIECQDPDLWRERMSRLQVLRDHVTKSLDEAFVNQSRYYNLRRRDYRLRVGELVLMRCRVLSSKAKQIAASSIRDSWVLTGSQEFSHQ